MTTKIKRPRMPKWLWQLPPQILNYKEKHFLAYVWWCADRGCRDWNWSLMTRFKCSRATVKRRIHKLEISHLIHIQYPRCKTRTIYRRPYFKKQVWIDKRPEDFFENMGSKVSHIYNAEHIKKYKTTSLHASGRKRKAAETAAALILSQGSAPNPASPTGLTGDHAVQGTDEPEYSVPPDFQRSFKWSATTARMEKVE